MEHELKVGDIVTHLFNREKGTITEVRDEEKNVYVEWAETADQKGWFESDVLQLVTVSN
jgi:hypothetical protein